MAVYFMPRDRNNFWWGGGRGGGVLDLIGQALIQPCYSATHLRGSITTTTGSRSKSTTLTLL